MSDDVTRGDGPPLTADSLLDTLAALRAETDQREARIGELLGLPYGVREDVCFLVSPDVGMRLTRDGAIPDRVRISWLLPSGSVYAVSPELF